MVYFPQDKPKDIIHGWLNHHRQSIKKDTAIAGQKHMDPIHAC